MYWIRKHAVLCAALSYFFIGGLLFASFLDNPFIMDDEVQIVLNYHIKDIDNWASFFTSSTMDAGGAARMGGVYFKPIMTTFFAAVWAVAGGDPFAFRLPLFFLFIASGIFIFLFSRKYLPPSVAYFLGLLFIIHPANSEVMFYIADAQDTMFMFFGLAALLALTAIEKPKWIAAAVIPLLLLATLSKETGVLFLAIICAYAFFLDRGKLKPALFSAFVVGVIYTYLRHRSGLTVLHYRSDLVFHQSLWWERLAMLPTILWHYVEILFFPLRLTLATDFRFDGFGFYRFWLALTGVGAFLALLIAFYRRQSGEGRRLYQFFALIMVLWFVLHGQVFVPLDGVYADRWFYLASWALFSMLVLGLKLPPNPGRRWGAIAGLILIACFARTFYRGFDWADPGRLYAREFRLNPENAVMTNNVGVIMFRDGKPLESKAYFQQATELNPTWNVAWNNLGAAVESEGNYKLALEYYLKCIALGDYAQAYENYAKLLIRLGEREKALAFIRKEALPRYPGNENLKSLSKMYP